MWMLQRKQGNKQKFDLFSVLCFVWNFAEIQNYYIMPHINYYMSTIYEMWIMFLT